MRSFYVVLVVALLCCVPSTSALAEDCNNNSIDDQIETSPGPLRLKLLSTTGSGAYATGAMLDIDLDGRDDAVFVTKIHDQFTLYASPLRGEIFFQLSPLRLPTSSANTFEEIALVDADANSFLDLQIAGETTSVTAYNRGDNSFSPRETATSQALGQEEEEEQPQDRHLLIVDLDGDGDLDEVRTNETGVSVSLRNDEGELVLKDTFSNPSLSCTQQNGSTAELLPAVDFDKDTDLDFISIIRSECYFPGSGSLHYDAISVFENDGNGSFVVHSVPAQHRKLEFLEYRDVNGDRLEDVVLQTSFISGLSFPPSVPRTSISGLALLLLKKPATTKDSDSNSIPDSCQRAVLGDFDGDRRGDTTVVRGILGLLNWFTNTYSSSANPEVKQFGLSNYDIPYAADFDGDGKFEPAVIRGTSRSLPGQYGLYWYDYQSDGSAKEIQWGLPGDRAHIGYFDADTKSDRAVVRTLSGGLYWYIRRSLGGDIVSEQWGLEGDRVYSGDVNADGIEELIVSRDINGGIYWFTRSLDSSYKESFLWGLVGDIPLYPSDYDGDGKVDFAVARSKAPGQTLQIYLKLSDREEAEVINFGLAGDYPFVSYTLGQDVAELSVYREAPGFEDFKRGLGYENQTFSLHASGLIRPRYWGLKGDHFILPNGRSLRME